MSTELTDVYGNDKKIGWTSIHFLGIFHWMKGTMGHTPRLGGIVRNVYEGCAYVQLVPYQSKGENLSTEPQN